MSVTIVIIILNVLISWQAFQNHDLLQKLKQWPFAEKKNSEYYRILSGTFVHGDWMHLAFNMYALYSFGTILEYQFQEVFGQLNGRVFYVVLYLVSGILANLMTYFHKNDNPQFASVGASGSVSGIMFSFIIFYPWVQLLLFYVIPIPGVIAAVLYLIYSTYSARKGGGIIDHTAHLWGAVTGFALTILFRPTLWTDFIQMVSDKF